MVRTLASELDNIEEDTALGAEEGGGGMEGL